MSIAGGGDERYRRNRALGIRDRAVAVHGSPEWNDYMAKEAEDYFARRYGLPFSDNRRPAEVEFILVPPCNHPDPHRTSPTTIDVKWTPYKTGRLIHSMTSRTRATIYVLVIGDDPTNFSIAGWAWGKDLHSSVIGPPALPVPTYALEQSQLRKNIDIQMATLGYLPIAGDFQVPLFGSEP